MNTNEILSNIEDSGGFNNFRNWYKDEVAIWVKSNYKCSSYVAKRVAERICK